MAELRGKRELFAREYLKDLNATQAAIRAGYSRHAARQLGSDTLREPEVQERISELAQGRNQELLVEARDVLLELMRMLTADVSLAFEEDGAFKSIHDIPIDLRRTIASIETVEYFEGEGRARKQVGWLKKVKFWSKEKAAELLGRHLALFNDKLLLGGLDDVGKQIIAARARAEPPLA